MDRKKRKRRRRRREEREGVWKKGGWRGREGGGEGRSERGGSNEE